MVKLTKKNLAIIAAGVGTADFLLEGKLSAPVARALKRYALQQAAKAPPRLAATAFQVGKTVAVRHPYLTAGALVYYGYKNRKDLGRLVEQGYDIIQPAAAGIVQGMADVNPGFENIPTKGKQTKRKKSSFNQAVSKSLKALRASKSYGKKGTISNAKAAFKPATQQASRAFRGKPVPRAGPAKVAYTASKKVYKDEILRRKMK